MLKGLLEEDEERERKRNTDTKGKMAMNKYLSLITSKLNGLNASIKKHRVAEWIRKHDLHICCLQDTHFRTEDLHRLNVKEWKKKIFQANGHEKKLR